MSKLPVEIIAEIIATVVGGTESDDPDRDPDPDERYPLVAASLVSRAWNSICRPHIFYIINIPINNIEERLWFLHSEAPHISQYIRIVRFKSHWNDAPNTTPAWYPECFGRLKNLRTLHLDHRVSTLLRKPGPLATGISSMFAAPGLLLRRWKFAEDGSDLLAILSATLGHLTLEDIYVTSLRGANAKSTPRLEALRFLELQEVVHPMLRMKNFIECPNLECLVARWHRYRPWDLPPWVPSSLSELVICAASDCDVPDFGTVVRPSEVAIYRSKDSTYLELFIWIRDCIRRLPFPNSIRILT